MTRPSLDARRKALVERCAEQRAALAGSMEALRPANIMAAYPAAGYVATHKTLVLGTLGAVVGIALVGRKCLPALSGKAASALSGWRAARSGMALLARLRG